MPKGILVVKAADLNYDTKNVKVTYDFVADNGYWLKDEQTEVTATTSVTQLNNNIKQAAAQKMAYYAWGTFANSDITIFGGAQ